MRLGVQRRNSKWNVPYSGSPVTQFNTDTVLESEKFPLGTGCSIKEFSQHLQEVGILLILRTALVQFNHNNCCGLGSFPDPLAPIAGRSMINNASLSVAAVYDIDMNGVVTAVSGHGSTIGTDWISGNNVRMNVGCGRIRQYGVDTNSTPARIDRGGTAMTIQFTFEMN